MKRHLLLAFFVCMLIHLNAQQANHGTGTDNQHIENKIRTKAIKAGLDDVKAAQLLELVFKRNAAYKEAEKNEAEAKAPRDIKRDIAKVKRAFSAEVAKLINKRQFLIIFGDDLKTKAKNKTKKEFKSIQKKYDLTEVQQEKVYKGVYLYHLYDTVDRLYHYANKTKRRQAKYMLRTKFRKDYQDLMNGYGITVNPVKKENNITFLW